MDRLTMERKVEELEIAASSEVKTVNGKSGVVELTAQDIPYNGGTTQTAIANLEGDVVGNTSDIEDLENKIDDFIKVVRLNDLSMTIPANSNQGQQFNVEIPEGYKLLGIVGVNVRTTQAVFCKTYYELSASVINLVLFNTTASERTVQINVDLLFVKNN